MSITEALSSSFGIVPIKQDRHGPAYSTSDVHKMCLKMIESDTYFERRVGKMMEDTTKAKAKIETMMKEFGIVIDKFHDMEDSVVEKSKKTTGVLKDSAERLAQGIARVEKAANFERLERYVDLLERAATAMRLLAELESTGKLDKIAGALK